MYIYKGHKTGHNLPIIADFGPGQWTHKKLNT